MAFSSGVPVSGYISIVLDCVIAAGELDGKRVVLAYLQSRNPNNYLFVLSSCK